MQGNEELKKRQILSAQIDLSKFNKGDFIKATEEEKKQQDVMGESTTFFKDGMKRLKKNPLAMGSIVILVLILALIIIAPFFVPYSYSDIITVDGKRDKTAANMAPFEYSKLEQQYMDRTGEKLFPHIFGTDNLSRDYFIRVIYGTRVSLSVGVAASVGLSMLRVLTGIPIMYFLIPGYAIALFLTLFVPKIFTAIAFDSGGVASGPMTATFLLPLAQGACTAVGGDVVKDAFGVVAMVAMTPLITLQVLGLIYKIKSNKKEEMAEQPFLQAEDVFAGYADDAIIEL